MTRAAKKYTSLSHAFGKSPHGDQAREKEEEKEVEEKPQKKGKASGGRSSAGATAGKASAKQGEKSSRGAMADAAGRSPTAKKRGAAAAKDESGGKGTKRERAEAEEERDGTPPAASHVGESSRTPDTGSQRQSMRLMGVEPEHTPRTEGPAVERRKSSQKAKKQKITGEKETQGETRGGGKKRKAPSGRSQARGEEEEMAGEAEEKEEAEEKQGARKRGRQGKAAKAEQGESEGQEGKKVESAAGTRKGGRGTRGRGKGTTAREEEPEKEEPEGQEEHEEEGEKETTKGRGGRKGQGKKAAEKAGEGAAAKKAQGKGKGKQPATAGEETETTEKGKETEVKAEEPAGKSKGKGKGKGKQPATAEEEGGESSRELPEDELEYAEFGRIYLLYRPKVDTPEVKGMGDVQRVYILLNPVKLDEKNPKASPERGCNRLIIVPRKSLPRKSGSTQWGFVDLVEGSLHKLGEEELGEKKYETPKSHAERFVQGARVCGSGTYAICTPDGKKTSLAYVLDLPMNAEDSEVLESMGVGGSGSILVTVKSPEKPNPMGQGLSGDQKASYPEELQAKFEGKRSHPLLPPDFLNHKGCELFFTAHKHTEPGPRLAAVAERLRKCDAEEVYSDIGVKVKAGGKKAKVLKEGEFE